jgi:hypothetical protein
MIRDIIHSAEASRYYHIRHPVRICLHQIYLLALTYYSVSTQSFHSCVPASILIRVLEY